MYKKSLKKIFSLGRVQIIFILLLYIAAGLYSSGILQTTVFAGEPQIHVVEPLSGGKPERMIFILHSASSRAEYLIPLARYMAPVFPDTVFILPDAPNPDRFTPFMFSWFHKGVQKRNRLGKKLEKTAPFLVSLINEKTAEYNVKTEDVALFGYSQGGVMALTVSQRLEKPIGAIVSLSGYIAGPDDKYKKAYRYKIPVFLFHGGRDTIVPPEEYKRAFRLLKEAGAPVEGVFSEVSDHDFTQKGADAGIAFLRKNLVK